MAYRVLALTIVAGVSLSSAALAKEHCPVGRVYFRSHHTCVAKGTAIARKIYHFRSTAIAKAKETAIVPRPARAHAASPAAAVPLPPVRSVGMGIRSAPARNETVDRSGSILPPTPEIVRQSVPPYGALVPVSPAK